MSTPRPLRGSLSSPATRSLIDDALLEEFAVADDYLAETVLLGLPFVLIWLFTRVDRATRRDPRAVSM